MSDPRTAPVEEVAVGLIVDGDGRLLLQHRDDRPGVAGAGLWGLFGGHIEPGEDPARAFLREIEEELAWRPRHFEHYLRRVVPALPRSDDRGYGAGVVSHVFAAHLDVAPGDLTLGEGQAMGLFEVDALPNSVVPSLVPTIAEFGASDAYRRARRRWDIITATAILVDSDGRLLLQHRDDKPGIDNPGMWGSFGGRIEDYETPEDGFLRELDEELSWRPPTFELYLATPYRPDERRQLIYVYAAPLDVPIERLVLGEGQGMASYSPDELPATTQPDYAALLRRFAEDPLHDEMVRRARATAAA
jgi:8-oxo-dGTP diphosphatase